MLIYLFPSDACLLEEMGWGWERVGDGVWVKQSLMQRNITDVNKNELDQVIIQIVGWLCTSNIDQPVCFISYMF